MRLIQSLLFALAGIKKAFRLEKNFKIQIIVSLAVALFGFLLRVSAAEWMVLILCCGIVLSCELVNSAVERICNFISPGIHPAIKKIKDYTAGAVLISAGFSVIIGLIIFLPKVMALFR